MPMMPPPGAQVLDRENVCPNSPPAHARRGVAKRHSVAETFVTALSPAPSADAATEDDD